MRRTHTHTPYNDVKCDGSLIWRCMCARARPFCCEYVLAGNCSRDAHTHTQMRAAVHVPFNAMIYFVRLAFLLVAIRKYAVKGMNADCVVSRLRRVHSTRMPVQTEQTISAFTIHARAPPSRIVCIFGMLGMSLNPMAFTNSKSRKSFIIRN